MAQLENTDTKTSGTGRSGARAAAQGTSGGSRRPSAESRTDNAAGGDQAQTTAAAPAGGEAPAAVEAAPRQPIPLVLIAPNPKRKGTIAFGFYEGYGTPVSQGGGLTTYEAVRAESKDKATGVGGVRGKDVSWDRDRGHILMGDEAANFPLSIPEGFEALDGENEVQTLRRAQCDYLKGLGKRPNTGFVYDDKRLIAWGLMPAPVEEKIEAKAEVKAEEAATA